MTTFDLLVVGDANPDVLLAGAPPVPPYGQAETLVSSGALALGGSAAIVAHGAARLGLSTALAAVVGRDGAGDFVLDVLTSAGVDIAAVTRHPDLPTALTICLDGPDGDRAILTAPGCLAAFDPAAFDPRQLPPARHIHAASYFLQPILAARLPDLFRTADATCSLDTNHDPSGHWHLTPGLLEACDYVLPNEAEALALTGTATVDAALAGFVKAGVVTPVVKRGRDGATARTGTELHNARLTPLVPVDTVGAGDSFDAGFLAAVLNGDDLDQALAIGCACGALSTREVGGTAAQPSWEQAVAYAAGSAGSADPAGSAIVPGVP
ncbi:carbohydrate kinase family protein [Catenulispora sp. NF23]|uniref:Carbohydrate kinase family protein n=1 Tax=Catenulispora pinistramenti TaxID=2705254 RepID=A0ABS5KPV6_9ACTN|nr:carbohydrate kinase family protein [Catenulispora pinistramenti]MBS2535278.1 carbohydrate kinase family protein [Catenulispora pinistramenti]MBS2548081.1 carbohydrate kinase family protein [Catenulispora pinistramenti]